MEFKDLFQEYYLLYRADSVVPDVTDPEWAMGVVFGNSAIRAWANVDGVLWDELRSYTLDNNFVTTYSNTSTTSSLSSYAVPDDMLHPPKSKSTYADDQGDFIRLSPPAGTITSGYFYVPVYSARQVQGMANLSTFGYFIGNAQTGYTLKLNIASQQAYNLWTIDYPYCRKPTYFDNTIVDSSEGSVNEDGTTVSECPDPSYLINKMLASRFRGDRNYSAMGTANADAAASLTNMINKNGEVTNIPNNEFGQSNASFGSI